ncbi:MAG: hypothetical protein KBT34_05515 [Prevotella sp.]|nr:hypothetical protein [Candidatus Prevotella equi]
MANETFTHEQIQTKVFEKVQAQMEQMVKDNQVLLDKMTEQNERLKCMLEMMK